MIRLDKNYTVTINSTHGFQLNFTSDVVRKELVTQKGKELKMVTTTDTWFYPKLSQILNKYYVLNLEAQDQEELLIKVKEIESKINTFSKTFANK